MANIKVANYYGLAIKGISPTNPPQEGDMQLGEDDQTYAWIGGAWIKWKPMVTNGRRTITHKPQKYKFDLEERLAVHRRPPDPDHYGDW